MTEFTQDEPSGETSKTRRDKRSTPSVQFAEKNGCADGWTMAVPTCFRPALDIQLTVRVKNKKKGLEWTEGSPPIYEFGVGDVFYDNSAAYEQDWRKTLKVLKFAVQVEDARPDVLVGAGKSDGMVVASVYAPTRDCRGVERKVQHRMSQSQFVELLKFGRLPDGKQL
jgi:hypothetical protein